MRVRFENIMTLFATTISLLSRRSSAFTTVSQGRLTFHRNFSPRELAASTEASSSIVDDEKLVQDMLYRIREVNTMTDEVRGSLLDFQVDGLQLGKVSQ